MCCSKPVLLGRERAASFAGWLLHGSVSALLCLLPVRHQLPATDRACLRMRSECEQIDELQLVTVCQVCRAILSQSWIMEAPGAQIQRVCFNLLCHKTHHGSWNPTTHVCHNEPEIARLQVKTTLCRPLQTCSNGKGSSILQQQQSWHALSTLEASLATPTFLSLSHWEMHSPWYRCLQGSDTTSSSGSNSMRHTAHCSSSSSSPLFPAAAIQTLSAHNCLLLHTTLRSKRRSLPITVCRATQPTHKDRMPDRVACSQGRTRVNGEAHQKESGCGTWCAAAHR